MENLNDESLRKLFKESGSRAIDNEPDIWFTRRVVSRLPRRSSIPGRIAWGVFIVVCIVAFGVYVDYVRLFMQTRDLHTLIGASMANPMVPVLLCFPVALSGISSSTTT